MGVYIRDLPIELQELVHKRQIEQGNNGEFDGYLENDKYRDNFSWVLTPEGREFWSSISCDYKDMKSHKFYPKKRVYEIC